MAPPNTLFIPEIANAHLNSAFFEIMDFLNQDLGVIDFVPGSERGGNFFEMPQIGQLSAGFERSDVAGTLTTDATATTTTNLNHRMVTLHRTLFHEYFTGSVIV